MSASNSQRIVDLLLKHGLIDLASVDDPEGYDNGATLAAVQALAADLSAGPAERDAVLEEAAKHIEKAPAQDALAEAHNQWAARAIRALKNAP